MGPNTCRITVRGRLSARFTAAFDGMALQPRHSRTVLVGTVRDQAHLFGVLDRVRDLGIELISVEVGDDDAARHPSRPCG